IADPTVGPFWWVQIEHQAQVGVRRDFEATTLVQWSNSVEGDAKALWIDQMRCFGTLRNRLSWMFRPASYPLGLLTVAALSVAPSGVNPTFGTVRFAGGGRPALGRKRPGAGRANCDSFRLAGQSHQLQGKCAPQPRSAPETRVKALGSWIVENHRPHPEGAQPHLGPCGDERPSRNPCLTRGGSRKAQLRIESN